MLGWLWRILHGPARQRRFLVEVRTLLELAAAGLDNGQLPRAGALGRDDLIHRCLAMAKKIDRILAN